MIDENKNETKTRKKVLLTEPAKSKEPLKDPCPSCKEKLLTEPAKSKAPIPDTAPSTGKTILNESSSEGK